MARTASYEYAKRVLAIVDLYRVNKSTREEQLTSIAELFDDQRDTRFQRRIRTGADSVDNTVAKLIILADTGRYPQLLSMLDATISDVQIAHLIKQLVTQLQSLSTSDIED